MNKKWIVASILITLILSTVACKLPASLVSRVPSATSTSSAVATLTPPPLTATPVFTATLPQVSPSLRNYAELKGVEIGTYFPWQGFADSAWREIAAREFDLANLFDGFSWADFEPEKGRFDFSKIGPYVEFALANNMQVCAHTMFWPTFQGAYPNWVLEGNFSRETMSELIRSYITTVMNHYQGKITCWIMVEEPFSLPKRDWDLLYSTFGDYSYIDLIYRIARETDPAATLTYNDEENFSADSENIALTNDIINQLKREGLVDGVGLCMHLNADDPPDRIAVTKTMASYGLPVHVTEIDVNLHDIPGTQQERYALQATIYSDMLNACLDSEQCSSFSVWGFGDKYSYLDRYYQDAEATLFDDDLQPKPAYTSLMEIMKP